MSVAEECQIVYVEKPEESAWGIIGRNLQAFNVQQVGDARFARLCFVLQAADQVIVGGILGEIYWGWLHVDLLWIKDEYRGRDYGHRLLQRVEDEARQRGATNAYLDTFSWQAPEFYRRYGYEVVAELRDFPPGHQRFFMAKQL